MDWKEGRKTIYVKYLDLIRPRMYTSVLDCNHELITKLCKKKTNHKLGGCPLWLFHGGELINLYSSEKNKTPTKDIDLKLHFYGDYSIPTSLLKTATRLVKVPDISKFTFKDYLEDDFDIRKGAIMEKFSSKLKKKTKSGLSCLDIWKMGEKQKIEISLSMVMNNYEGIYSQINLNTGTLKQGLMLEDFKTCTSQKWINGDNYKAFIVNIPYVTQCGQDNFPYDINTVLSLFGSVYNEEINGHEINRMHLEDLDIQLRNYIEKPELQIKKNRIKYISHNLEIICLRNLHLKLTSIVGVVIVYNETRNKWILFQEGIMDLYIDYNSAYHIQDENRFYGRYSDGSIPSVIKKVQYGNKKGIMRVPTLTWLIYDQLRMLYIVIRDQYLNCNEKRCQWIELGGGAAGNYEKYFKKLRGLLNSFERILNQLEKNNPEDLREALQECHELDFEICGFQPFITSLFRDFDLNIFGNQKNIGRKKKTGKVKHKKRSSKKRSSKTVKNKKKRIKKIIRDVDKAMISLGINKEYYNPIL